MVADTRALWAEPALVTAEHLLHFPRDGWRYELVAGTLVRMTPTGINHGRIALTVGSELLTFVRDHALGVVCGAETGFLLSAEGEPDTVLAPDVAFISAARVPRTMAGYARLAPDLVGEVASPNQSRQQLAAKAQLYLAAGVRIVWVIWPQTQTVDVWVAEHPGAPARQLSHHDILEANDLLPGFSLRVADLFL